MVLAAVKEDFSEWCDENLQRRDQAECGSGWWMDEADMAEEDHPEDEASWTFPDGCRVHATPFVCFTNGQDLSGALMDDESGCAINHPPTTIFFCWRLLGYVPGGAPFSQLNKGVKDAMAISTK